MKTILVFLIASLFYHEPTTAISSKTLDFGQTMIYNNIKSEDILTSLMNHHLKKNYFDINLEIYNSAIQNFEGLEEYFERYIKKITIVQNLTNIDQNAFYKFQNLYSLEITQGKIKTFKGFNMNPYNNNFNNILNLTQNNIEKIIKICPNDFRVEVILLQDNEIRNFEQKNIGFCLGTKYLDLSFNKITAIDANIFQTLNALEKIGLGSNQIESFTNSYVPDRYFTGKKYKFSTISVIELYLNDNDLTVLGDNTFKYFTKLKKLNLKNNPLLKLEGDVFKNLYRLVHLNIENIKFVNRSTLKDLRGLIYLNMTINNYY